MSTKARNRLAKIVAASALAGTALLAAAGTASAAAAEAATGGTAATPALAAQDLNFVATHRFEPRTSTDSLRTTAVFPAPGPAGVSLSAGAGTGGQWLTFNHKASGTVGVVLKNRAAGLCLDTADGLSSASVAVRACDDTTSQNWIVASVPGTNFQFFTVQNAFTKKFLTKNGVTGVNLQASSSGNDFQQWKFIQDET
jgi:hypothetical protein